MTAAGATVRRKIVVGIDGSKSSDDALLWARRMGHALDADIEVVLAWQYPLTYAASAYVVRWDPAAEAVKVMADAVRTAFQDDVPSGLRTSVQRGHPAHVLIDASADADLLIVGSRGHGGFTGLLIGATSAYCAEHASCSVLVAHGSP